MERISDAELPLKVSQSGGLKPLILLDDGHVPWHVCGDGERGEVVVYARGYAISGGRFFEDDRLAAHVQQVAREGAAALHSLVPDLNGGWAFVVKWPTGQVLAAVDRMRSVPLFFYHNHDDFAIAASGMELAHHFSLPMSVTGQLKFLLVGYVSGADTLYEGVKQIQPGEIIDYRPDTDSPLIATRYYRFYPPGKLVENAAQLAERLEDIIGRMFERFCAGYRGERVVVPLSGGLDSRLIACMLKRYGIENCECFTYGADTSKEVQLSRAVAEALGYPWRQFSHSPEVFKRWDGSEAFRDFWRYACKGVSKPNDLDFSAMMQLADEGFQGAETIFFPGHSADMNAGNHIPPDYADIKTGRLSVIDEIVRHHSAPVWFEPRQMLNSREGHAVLTAIAEETAPPLGANQIDYLDCCEMWTAEQRQSKYIINCVRAYEFVGSRWRTLWDYEFMDFFMQVPDELRYAEQLYLDCLRDRIFTGEFATLNEIPVTGYGPLKSITSLRRPARQPSAISRHSNTLKRAVRWQLMKFGRTSSQIKSADPLRSSAVRLRALGILDPSITFSDAMARIGVLPLLSPEIQTALSPWWQMRVESLPWFAVFIVLVLAEMSRGKGR